MPEVLTDSLFHADAGEVMQIMVFMSCYTRPEPSLVETTPSFCWLVSPPRVDENLRQCSSLMEWENAALNWETKIDLDFCAKIFMFISIAFLMEQQIVSIFLEAICKQEKGSEEWVTACANGED